MKYTDEIVTAIVERGLAPTKVAARELLNGFTTLLKDLVKDDGVAIAGFGQFKEVVIPAHTARNPSTGGQVDVPAKVRLKFKAASNTTRVI